MKVTPGAQASRRGSMGEVLAAVLLLAFWIVLWSFFVTAVVEPGARLGSRAVAHGSTALSP